MRTLLIKAMLPVAAFALASAGAVSTKHNDAPTDKLVTVQGWKRTAAFQCTAVKECNQIGSVLCFSGTDQMYGKPNDLSDCTDILTHRP